MDLLDESKGKRRRSASSVSFVSSILGLVLSPSKILMGNLRWKKLLKHLQKRKLMLLGQVKGSKGKPAPEVAGGKR